MKDIDEIFREIIKKCGKEAQIIVAIEELAELQQQLTKYLRGKDNKKSITEEMADVGVMLRQLELIFDNEDDVINFKVLKILRTRKRILGE